MKNLTDLFKILELMRSQPQYGYVLAGIKQDDLSNLAEHHFLVTFIAWQIVSHLRHYGAGINIQKVLELALVHDLGELLGGDIAMPYARANQKARTLAKNFEVENNNFLSQFFGEESKHFKKLSEEMADPKSDEGKIVKIADYLEITHYKFYIKVFSRFDIDLVKPKLQKMCKGIKDPIAKRALNGFITQWVRELPKKAVIKSLGFD